MAYSLTDYSSTEIELNDGSRSYYYKKCYCSVELQGETIILTSHKVERNAGMQYWAIAYTDFTNPTGSANDVYVAIQAIINSYVTIPKAYLSAFDTTTQTATAINTGYAMSFSDVAMNNGVYAVGTWIQVDKSGVYNIQFSAQLENSATQDHDVDIWLVRNGANEAWTNSKVSIPSKHGGVNGHTIVAWNFVIFIDRNDIIELYWQTDSLSVYIPSIAPSHGEPETPSIILTVVEV